MKKVVKGIFIALGFICFVLGAAGAALPVLPTTPFLLASAFCFARGSERVNQWFRSTKLYKKHLDSFVHERSMFLKTKVCILVFASTMLIIAFLAMQNLYGRIFIVLLITFKTYYFLFRIKTKKPTEEEAHVRIM